MSERDYRVHIQPLCEEDGGGYLAVVPDLPGCMSDGETEHEALDNVQDAIREWISTAEALGRQVPRPTRELTVRTF